MCYCRKDCILRDIPRKTENTCGDYCPHRIALHGMSGKGGRVNASNVPDEYKNFTLTDNPIRADQPKAYKVLDKYVETFSRMLDAPESPSSQIKNIYLWSRAKGTGKTATASILVNEWIKRSYLMHLQAGLVAPEKMAYVLDMVELQTLYNFHTRGNVAGSEANDAFEKYSQMVTKAKDADFLVIDDIGARGSSEAFTTDLHWIVNHRYTKRKPTVYTSNVPMEELEKIYDGKLYDRIRDLTIDIEFTGQSKRGGRK